MKKFFLIIFIVFITLFLSFNKIKGIEYLGKEDHFRLYFDNLNSKNLDQLFSGINTVIIEIEVKTSSFTKSYRLNIIGSVNLEENLKKKVINDLIEMGKREEASYLNINGFKIIRIDLRCTESTLEIIKERSKNV